MRHPLPESTGSAVAVLTLHNCPRRLINDGVQLQCGPKVISDRLAVEKAGYVSQNQTFGPVGAAIRYTNFTAHPSISTGALLRRTGGHRCPEPHVAVPKAHCRRRICRCSAIDGLDSLQSLF